MPRNTLQAAILRAQTKFSFRNAFALLEAMEPHPTEFIDSLFDLVDVMYAHGMPEELGDFERAMRVYLVEWGMPNDLAALLLEGGVIPEFALEFSRADFALLHMSEYEVDLVMAIKHMQLFQADQHGVDAEQQQ